MEVSEEWTNRATWLFQNISKDGSESVVCISHMRFIPCRKCMYQEVAIVPYSNNPVDIEIVRLHHER